LDEQAPTKPASGAERTRSGSGTLEEELAAYAQALEDIRPTVERIARTLPAAQAKGLTRRHQQATVAARDQDSLAKLTKFEKVLFEIAKGTASLEAAELIDWANKHHHVIEAVIRVGITEFDRLVSLLAS
jgi:transketolase